MNLRRGTSWLVVTGLVLVLFVLLDNARSWRRWQVEDARRRAEILQERLQEEQGRLESVLPALEDNLEEQRRLWRDQAREIDDLTEQRRAFEYKQQVAEQRMSISRKAFEEALANGEVGEDTLESLRQTMLTDRREVEGFADLVADRQAKLDSMAADLVTAEDELQAARQPLETLQQELDTLSPTGFWSRWTSLGFGGGVRQAQPSVLRSDPPAVDRCTTCHLGALEPGRDGSWPAVLRSHPQPEIFLRADSPHPYGRFGCTVCHGGDGRATDFTRADHDLRGDDDHLTMLPLELLDAGCRQCHLGSTSDPSGIAAAGRRMFIELGCGNCHGDPSQRRRAPALTGLGDKVQRQWLDSWLREPVPGHPVLSASGPGDAQQRLVEAAAVAAYLSSNRRADGWPAAPKGDADRGRRLFESLGCRACHVQDEDPAAAPSSVGPALSGASEKLRPSWLHAWLMDPQGVRPGTTMPSFRLRDDEAAALTAWLAPQQEALLSEETSTDVDGAIRDRLLFDLTSQRMSLQATQARIDAMDEPERLALLGQRLVETRGCGGCHLLPESSAGAAGVVPLEGLHVASADRLAASHVPELAAALDKATGREQSVRQKMSARGPDYLLDEEQAMALLTAVLNTPHEVSETSWVAPSEAVARGEALMTRLGCRACHQLGGWGGEALSAATGGTSTALSRGPGEQVAPSLDGIGRRTQPVWLDAYLRDPSRDVMRPWLEVRMPTYALSQQERSDLVAYFLALDEVSALHGAAPSVSRRDLTVGSVIFEILQCDRCHAEQEDFGGHEISEQAPSYRLASRRLRPEWVVEWLLEPHRLRPGTNMPRFFGERGAQDLSYLRGTFDSPMFFVQHQRLLQTFESEDEMERFLMDRQRVATSLRDYMWSLGEASNLR